MPFQPGTVLRCSQGPGGTYSHAPQSNSTSQDLDFPAGEGTNVVAAAGGTAFVFVDQPDPAFMPKGCPTATSKSFGNHVNIDHGGGLFTVYAHLKTIEPGIHGTVVKKGDVIGTVDSTGYSCGNHLHFGLHKGDPRRPGTQSQSVLMLRLFAKELPSGIAKLFTGSEIQCGDQDVGTRYEAVRPDPSLLISAPGCAQGVACSAPQGSTFDFHGTGFTPSGSVRRLVLDTSTGMQAELFPALTADVNGDLSWSILTTCSSVVGAFELFAEDVFTGKTSNRVTKEITPGVCPVLAPAISVTPSFFDFGGVQLGSSTQTTFTITNSGNATLTVSSISITPGDFALNASSFPTPPFSLNPGAAQSFEVAFMPSILGPAQADITVVSNAPSSPTVVRVSGMGVALPRMPRFTSTGSMASARSVHTATLLVNGLVLVAGGIGASSSPLNTAELYDPRTGTWRNTRFAMNMARVAHTATRLADGRVLIAGGANGTGTLDSAEIFDPQTEQFIATGSMAVRRQEHEAVLLNDGKVLVIAGRCSSCGDFVTPTNEIFDPANGTWSSAASLPVGVTNHTASLLPDGGALVTGGYDGFTRTAYSFVNSYDPASGTWRSMAPLLVSRLDHTATVLDDGKVSIVAGSDPVRTVTSTEMYDPLAGNSGASGVGNPLAVERRSYTATRLPDGSLLVIGGFQSLHGFGGAVFVDSAELFDARSGTWSQAGSLFEARGGHTATLLSSGRVLVAGGNLDGVPLSSAEVWEPGAATPSVSVSYNANHMPWADQVPWIRSQAACSGGVVDTTSAQPNGGVLEIQDFDSSCDHLYKRFDVLHPSDDAEIEWRVRVPFATHPAAVGVGLSDGTKFIHVGHSATFVALMFNDPLTGAITGFLGVHQLDATQSHTYKLVKSSNQNVRLLVDGVEVLSVLYQNLSDFSFGGPIQFFGAGSNFERSQSYWDFLHYTNTSRPEMQTCVQPPSGLVSWWPLDGNAGDISNGNSGVLEGVGGQFVLAKVSSGFRSGGQQSLIRVNDAPSLDVSQFTIDAWIRVDAINPLNMPIVWKGDSSGTDVSSPYTIGVWAFGPISPSSLSTVSGTAAPGKLFALISDGAREHIVLSDAVLPIGLFTHVVVTADGSQVRIYINGQLDTQVTQSVIPFSAAFPLQIGSLSGATQANFFNGIIDELEIFDRPLGLIEIQSIFNAAEAGKCKGIS